jgi:hypothetical protein
MMPYNNQNMEGTEPESEIMSSRAIRLGSLACLISALVFWGIAHALVSRMQVWWMEALVYSLVPISVTFIILYRSCWRREITGAARTLRLLAFSCLIATGEVVAGTMALALMLDDMGIGG